jgi:hypothetical protein
MPNGRAAGERGVSYLMLLVAVAIIGASAAYSVRLGADIQRRWAEDELLRIGAEFDRAFASYRAARPLSSGVVNPRELEELLRDPRYPSPRRHLRKIFGDPLGTRTWGVWRAADGSIIGVFSMAAGKPLKQRGFSGSRAHFSEAQTYADWVFGASPEALELKRRELRSGPVIVHAIDTTSTHRMAAL